MMGKSMGFSQTLSHNPTSASCIPNQKFNEYETIQATYLKGIL